MNTTYFDWLQRETPTRWWHDSGNPDEIDLALKRRETTIFASLGRGRRCVGQAFFDKGLSISSRMAASS